ncbi:methionine ABC transporter permease [uncultured Gulosibacter sp.]|uniref:methionine ABC transporter permease n=1 Tax=uncultured Gulosibacter sp. TaxID=1339167 RepID=UPI00288A6DBB|nr:methionine ABC transporter permease [uncultured Gulosibacter sp.]
MTDINHPEFWPQLWQVLLKGTGETLYMASISMLITLLVGLPLGIILVATERGGFLARPFGQRWLGATINTVLSFIVNVGRSVPFIVLMVALIPVTRWVMLMLTQRPTFIGTQAATIPLTLVAIPFFARMVEIAVREVDAGLLEAADSLGASRWLTVRRVIMPEATPAIILGVATTLTSIINFSAMVGTVGGGGLGQVAISYGHERYSPIHMVAVIIILFVFVQLIQTALTLVAKRYGRERPKHRTLFSREI